MSTCNPTIFLQTITRSERVLVCAAAHGGTDSLSASLGLFLALKKRGVVCDLYVPNIIARKRLTFLEGIASAHAQLPSLRACVLELDLTHTKAADITYETLDTKLRVTITPKEGGWNKDSIQALPAKPTYDLIIAIGAPNHTHLHELFTHHAELLHTTPLINIDCSIDNEQYASINLVDITKATSSEIVLQLLESIDPHLITESVASALLAGIIDGTHSFKHKRVNPKTLDAASRLMEYGAPRETIISRLYQTQTITTLRFWGRLLSRLKTSESGHVACCILTRQDLLPSEELILSLPDILQEILHLIPHVQVAVALYETETGTIDGSVMTSHAHSIDTLFASFSPEKTGIQTGTIHLGKRALLEAQQHIREQVNV